MKPDLRQVLILLWGLGGVEFLLIKGVSRMAPKVQAAFEMQPSPGQWVFAGLWLVFMLYSEGYRGFQLRMAPRVAARGWHLAQNPRPLHLLFAPFFCVGYFHANRRRLITSWTLSLGIVGLVRLVHLLPQPWRGLVDLGVVGGLSWGVVALLFAAFRGPGRADPQLPGT